MLSPGRSKALRQCWVCKQSRNTLGKGANIAAIHNVTGSTIEDCLSNTSASRGNDRPLTAHRLQGNKSVWLLTYCRIDDNIRFIVQRRHFCVDDRPELHAFAKVEGRDQCEDLFT